MVLHAVTSRPMMTKYDPWVNMLRTCVAAFAAGVGGADAVTVLPFDARLGLPDAFSRRIARNTSSLLVEESHVAKVADPAGGAFAVEKLTDDLAVAGWEELGRIEEAGGVLDGARGRVAARPDRRGRRRARPADRQPHAAADRAHRVPEPARDAARAGAVRRGCARRSAPTARPSRRCATSPPRAKVFLATMGTVAAHTARATFATNLFAAGGIDVVNEGRHDDVGRRARALRRAAGRLPGRPRQGVRRVGRRARHGAPRGRRPVGRSSRASRVEGIETDDTCAMGVDALDFLHADEGEAGMTHPGELRRPAARRRGHRDRARRGRDVGVARGHRHPAGLRTRAPRGPRRAGHLPRPGAVPPRSLPDDVHHPAVDDPPVRRLLHRRGVQRLLPPQPRGRPEGAVASPSTWPPTAATTPTTRG